MSETARCSLLTRDCGTIYFLFDDPKDPGVKGSYFEFCKSTN